MLALPMTLLAVLALAAAAPAAPSAPPAAATDADAATDAATAASAATSAPLPAAGASSALALTLEARSEEEAPEGELGAGEWMEGAENIVFKPLFRYRERGGFRRRVRESNRRRDANYRRTYAARFPHHRYRPSPKRRNARRHNGQILF